MERIEFIVADDEAGLRLDSYLAERIEGTSRSEIKRAIIAGFVSLSGTRSSSLTSLRDWSCTPARDRPLPHWWRGSS